MDDLRTLAGLARPEAAGEVREAEWSLHPASERETAELAGRSRGWRRAAWGIGLVGFGLCPISLLGLLLAGAPWMLGLVVSAGLLGYLLLRSGREVERLRAERIRLQDEHAAVPGWIVDLTVLQGAAPTGRDRGVVWFEEGRLLFLGRRTSFALAAEAAEGKLWSGWATSGSTLPLRARSAAGRVALAFEFVPWDGPIHGDSLGSYAFAQAVRSWLATEASIEGGLPPLAFGPDAPSSGSLLFAALGTTGFWILSAWGAVLIMVREGFFVMLPVTMIVGLTLLGFGDVWLPRHRWCAWRDRRRLEKAQWKR